MQVLFCFSRNSCFLRDNANFWYANVCILQQKWGIFCRFDAVSKEGDKAFSLVDKNFSKNFKKPLAIRIDL